MTRGLAVVLALLLLIGGAVAWHQHSHARASLTQDTREAARMAAPPVEMAAAVPRTVRVLLESMGTVTPLATITVKTQIAGQLQKVAFTEGQMVHKGDLLAEIDPRPYQALLEQQLGQLAHDEALLAQAQSNLQRYRAVLARDAIPRQQVDDQQFLVQQLEASIRTDHAQISTQRLNLEYCRIASPVDGQVGLRQVDPGNFVQTSDPNGIVVVTQLQPISVIFPLPEDSLPQALKLYRGGARLSVTALDRANTTEIATGTLSNIDNQIDTTTGTWKLRASFSNANSELFPNQFVNVRLLLRTLNDVLTVPSAAIQHGAPGTYVYLIRVDDTVTVRRVETGAVDGGRVQVISGLKASDRVVISGTDMLREGMLVRVEAGEPINTSADDPRSAQ